MRLPEKADFNDFAELWADAEMLKDLPFSPQTRAESWPRFLRLAGSWALLGYGTWFVYEKSGAFIGLVGFLDGMREFGVDFDQHRELSYVINPVYQGKGYATEACIAALSWLETQNFGTHTVCYIGAGHSASISVAKKCGYNLLRYSQDEQGKATLLIRKNTAAI